MVDVQDGVGDVPRQGLEQGERAGARDGGGHHVGHRPVVDGVGQGVGHPGRPQVDVEVEVDLERLGPLLLLGQHHLAHPFGSLLQFGICHLHLIPHREDHLVHERLFLP